jgi:hypothetical protein
MKTTNYTFYFILLLLACSCRSATVQVMIENPSDFDRVTDLAEIPLVALDSLLALEAGQVYEVRNSRKEIIPSQVTFDGKLLFQAGLKAKESLLFTIAGGTKQIFKPQTYGRLISERKDDFAWENDRVAFRIYSQALIPVDGPSNGLDIWYKRTNELVIDKWYKNDLAGVASYHDDNGEGLDDYKVGRTLGAGAMAPYTGNKLWLNENFVSCEILDNGPLRTTFKVDYKEIAVENKSFEENRTFSIDAGSQLSKVIQEYGTNEVLTVAAGIVKRTAGDSLMVAPDKTYIEYLEPGSKKATGIYLGLVFPQGIDNVQTAMGHVLAITTYQPRQPIVYYTGYGWSQFGFANECAFQKYLENFVKSLEQPFIITINNN